MRFIMLLVITIMLASGPAGATDSLFDRLGRKEGITTIVNRTIDLSVADPRISSTFGNTNIVRLKKLLAEQICELSGGPCKYTGRSMQKSHSHLKIRTYHFNALVEDLQTAMDESDIPNATQNELLAILAPMQRDVTTGSSAPTNATQPQ
jgi:hemoglobin